jgi:hypothetical protein
VTVEPPQAGATDAVVDIEAAAESAKAGITRLEVVADPAIGADLVTMVRGPAGWGAAAAPSGGFAVEGPALPVGTDATVRLVVRRLPDAPRLVFKVLQTYADGTVVHWIDLPADGTKPEHPAPVVTLSAAAVPSPAPTGQASPTSSPTVHASPSTPAASPTSAPAPGGSFPWIPAVMVAVVLPLAVLVFARGRGRMPRETPGEGPRDPEGGPPV